MPNTALRIDRDDGSMIYLNKHKGTYEFSFSNPNGVKIEDMAPISPEHMAEIIDYIGDDPEGTTLLADVAKLAD